MCSPGTEKATTEINSYVLEDEDKETDDSYDTDMFDQFDQALAEYEEDLLLKSSSLKTPDELREEPANPVDTLLENTNSLLRDLQNKYDQVKLNVEALQNFVLKMQQSDFEERLSSRLESVEAKHGSSMKSLKVFIESEDRAREQTMLMRFEDFRMLRQTTASRLSVYETRLDTLEEMVLDLNQVISPPPPSPLPPPPPSPP